MSPRLPKQDSAVGRSIKTYIQAFIGALVTFGIGLSTAVNGVPGCSDAVVNYVMDFVKDYFFWICNFVGVGAGITALIWNLIRKSVPNY